MPLRLYIDYASFRDPNNGFGWSDFTTYTLFSEAAEQWIRKTGAPFNFSFVDNYNLRTVKIRAVNLGPSGALARVIFHTPGYPDANCNFLHEKCCPKELQLNSYYKNINYYPPPIFH